MLKPWRLILGDDVVTCQHQWGNVAARWGGALGAEWWRWLVQHWDEISVSDLERARAFLGDYLPNSFHPSGTPQLLRQPTPNSACIVRPPPGGASWTPQQPTSRPPLVLNRGETCSSPARCVPCRFPATTTQSSRTGGHQLARGRRYNFDGAMPGFGLSTTRI
jgi:hypothetical protein